MLGCALKSDAKAVVSPDSVDVAVNICLQVGHSPAPVDQEQTNAETAENRDCVKRMILRIVKHLRIISRMVLVR